MGHGDHSLDSEGPARLSNFRIYGIRWYRRGGIWCCTVRSNVNRCTVGVYRDDSWSADAALPDDVREHAFAMRPARDCLCGRHTLTDIPAKDWVLATIRDRGAGHHYRYQVSGTNLNFPPCHPSHNFTWSVPTLDDERYDTSTARQESAQ